MGLADLHIHTIYSYDGTASVESVLEHARRVGLDVIAITDHDEIHGALRALELAPRYGVDVVPGIEITTADGDLLALFITEKVDAGLSLEETVLRVGALGGLCIAPHPMAAGMGMKSLSAFSIWRALRNPRVAEVLVGIEAYNATAIDVESNFSAAVLAKKTGLAPTGNSDAHVAQAIGLGSTGFAGCTAADLRAALLTGATVVNREKRWNTAQVLGSWAASYLMSLPARLKGVQA